MNMKLLPNAFTICKIDHLTDVNFHNEFVFLCKTDEELSLVCDTDSVPENTIAREDGWKAMRIEGELDFSLIGILARISSLLTERQISLFAVSTYNTDYILFKEEKLRDAIDALNQGGFVVTK